MSYCRMHLQFKNNYLFAFIVDYLQKVQELVPELFYQWSSNNVD